MKVNYFEEEVITSGGLKCTFNRGDLILKEKDIIMLVHGAHGFKVIKNVEMIEIKQGPYITKLDKIKFNETNEKKIKIKR